jgi:hypothetical protein
LTLRCTHTALIACGALLITACQSPEQPKTAAPTPEAFTIHIDRGDNGAVKGRRHNREDKRTPLPRVLAFEMSGIGEKPPAVSEADSHAAARQAAVIEAFASALIEARRSRGQPTADFSAKLGPRLTVRHESLYQGRAIEVRLNTRGVETVFTVRNGELQHPPRDFAIVRRVFAETNGEFSLLAAGPATASDQYVATVACYLPRPMGTALAGGSLNDEP